MYSDAIQGIILLIVTWFVAIGVVAIAVQHIHVVVRVAFVQQGPVLEDQVVPVLRVAHQIVAGGLPGADQKRVVPGVR